MNHKDPIIIQDETNLWNDGQPLETTPEPEVSTHELTYPGVVDVRPGTHLGPGIDGRVCVAVGSYVKSVDPQQTCVVVESWKPAEPEVPAFLDAICKSVAARYELAMMDAADIVGAGRA